MLESSVSGPTGPVPSPGRSSPLFTRGNATATATHNAGRMRTALRAPNCPGVSLVAALRDDQAGHEEEERDTDHLEILDQVE
nr:hypothetical protein GCM10020241_35720 [Streptoalloteichus tenebrarius]